MAPYWKMFEPRVPGFVHIPTCYPYRSGGRQARRDGGPDRGARCSRRRSCARAPDTVAAFIAEPIHGGGGVLYPDRRLLPAACARSATGTTCCSSPTRSSPASAARASGSRSSTGTCSPTSCRSPRASPPAICRSAASWSSKAIKEAMDAVKPEDRWMHAYTYSGHPTCCAVGLKNIEIMERERLWENARRRWARGCTTDLQQAFGDHPHVGDIRGGKGLLAAVELVEDTATKATFAGRQEGGAARAGGDDEARRHDARPASSTSSSRRRWWSARPRSTASSPSRATR